MTQGERGGQTSPATILQESCLNYLQNGEEQFYLWIVRFAEIGGKQGLTRSTKSLRIDPHTVIVKSLDK
jgi:hypothetical protein